jgi:hypothetical protein
MDGDSAEEKNEYRLPGAPGATAGLETGIPPANAAGAEVEGAPSVAPAIELIAIGIEPALRSIGVVTRYVGREGRGSEAAPGIVTPDGTAEAEAAAAA